MSQYKTMITDLSRYVNVYKTDQSGADCDAIASLQNIIHCDYKQ